MANQNGQYSKKSGHIGGGLTTPVRKPLVNNPLRFGHDILLCGPSPASGCGLFRSESVDALLRCMTRMAD